MTTIMMILLLTIFQFAAGFGLLSMFKVYFKPGIFIPLCVITGVGIFSFIPFVLQLLYIPITRITVFLAILVVVILLNTKSQQTVHQLREKWQGIKFRIRIYEAPALLLIGFIVFVSVWRCFYYPPYPRDLTSGAEVIAEYTVREHTMVNSVFTVNLESTNNQFKPPYITSLQVIYKYAGFPFGQIWLSTLFICLLVLLFHVLIIRLHRLIAGLFLVFFLAIPEMYAYTFMALFDYSNAIFFFLSAFFIIEYFDHGRIRYMGMAGIMMGLATYTRSETLVLAGFLYPLIIWHHIKNWDGFRRIFKTGLLFLVPSIIVYILTVTIYINFYLPVHYPLKDVLNPHLLDPSPFFKRFTDINSQLVFGETGIEYYGYFIFIFLVILLLDLILSDKWNAGSRNWLYVIVVVYFGLTFLGYLLPLLDLHNSTKRGMFKIFPPMLMYMGSCGLLYELSEKIRRWEKT